MDSVPQGLHSKKCECKRIKWFLKQTFPFLQNEISGFWGFPLIKGPPGVFLMKAKSFLGLDTQ